MTATAALPPANTDLADYFRKCTRKALKDEAHLAQQTILARRAAIQNQDHRLTIGTILLYHEDIRFAQERMDLITAEFLRRQIP